MNKNLRRRILEKGNEIGSTHFASAFSCLDAIKYLYDNVLKKEDIFILSKGHAEGALFAVLETRGFKPEWTIHLDLNEKEGIYATTGSLGHGFPQGVGRAHAKKILNQEGKIYVMVGDGEMESGSNYESLALASKLNLDNIVLMIDWNKYQATGNVKDIGGITSETLSARLKSFGWNTYLIKGHSEKGLKTLKKLPKGLNAVILDTIKGKGLKCLEKNNVHGYIFNFKEYKIAMEELTN